MPAAKAHSPQPDSSNCPFCQIAAKKVPAAIVYEDDTAIAFLDTRPLFPGHVLLCPRAHYNTFTDLPGELVGPLFRKGQLIAAAVEATFEAEGTFVAMNNRISQSVPHLHVHIVPRRRGDGLKGFFWPRHKYENEDAIEAARHALEREIRQAARAAEPA